MQRIKNYISRLIQGEKKIIENPPADVFTDLKMLCRGEVQTIFDIGAYHGSYARKIDQYIAFDKCYCFEPYPPSYEVMKNSLPDKKFLTFQLALSDAAGISDFFSNHFDETNSLRPSIKTNSQIDSLIVTRQVVRVEVDTLDGFCAKNQIDQIDILKIDAQGNTFNVLSGGKHLLERNAVRFIQCEVEFIEIYKDEQLFHKIAGFLEGYGYTLYSLYNLHFDINNRLSWADAIFTKV